MNNTFLILAIFFVSLPSFFVSVYSAEYLNEEHKVAFEYPTEWIIKEPTNYTPEDLLGNLLVTLYPDTKNINETETSFISVRIYPETSNPEFILNDYYVNCLEEFEGCSILSKEKTYLQKFEVPSLTLLMQDRTQQLIGKSESYFITNGKKVYGFHYLTPGNETPYLLDTLKMIKSAKFLD
ncbi:MAG: hypothetical protein ACPKQO_10985 [Nitrososphaeraceae archaeon]